MKRKENETTAVKIRISNSDLQSLKRKAEKCGVKYQTLINEILRMVATS